MLTFPATNAGTAFIVVIDKARHRAQYAHPEDPVQIAMKFLFERLEFYLRSVVDTAYCIYDHDTTRTASVHEESISLIRGGSKIDYFSSFYGEFVSTTHDLSHITELALAMSHNSLGLQVADFFATCAYTYYRDGKRANCGWWNTLCNSLYTDGDLTGRGLKVFP